MQILPSSMKYFIYSSPWIFWLTLHGNLGNLMPLVWNKIQISLFNKGYFCLRTFNIGHRLLLLWLFLYYTWKLKSRISNFPFLKILKVILTLSLYGALVVSHKNIYDAEVPLDNTSYLFWYRILVNNGIAYYATWVKWQKILNQYHRNYIKVFLNNKGYYRIMPQFFNCSVLCIWRW